MTPPGPGFPDKIEGELAWKGADLEANPDSFTEYLAKAELDEIVAAIEHVKALGVARGHIDPTTFPLSEAFANRLKSVLDHVYNGRGFHRIKGLEPSRYTQEDMVIAYAGLTSYVADQRARNIDHIRDRTFANPNGETLKPLELSVPMAFHTDIDTGDILTMFVQSTPLEGGDQYIASMATMYNDLLESDPEVLKTLAEDWYWERAYRTAPYKEITRTFNRPIIGMESGHIQVNYAATLVGGNPEYPHSENAPPLTPEKSHAIDAIQESAQRTCLRIKPEPGDIIFINNYAMLHSRSGWVDSRDDVWKQRYILRLWLRDTENGWKSAPALKRVLDDKFDLGPGQQCLMTGDEWQRLPRPLRIKEMGVAASDCHD